MSQTDAVPRFSVVHSRLVVSVETCAGRIQHAEDNDVAPVRAHGGSVRAGYDGGDSVKRRRARADRLFPDDKKTIRDYYAAWEKKDWRPLDGLIADDFTFSSAASDDHISKSVFKARMLGAPKCFHPAF